MPAPFVPAYVPRKQCTCRYPREIGHGMLLDSSAALKQYLSRTYSTSATVTVFEAVRRCRLGVVSPILGNKLYFNASDQLVAFGSTTAQVFRDLAGWYLIAAGPSGLWVNGVELIPSLSTANLASASVGYDGSNYFDGEIAELHILDGVDAPHLFTAMRGEHAVFLGYSGEYGAGGCHLDFARSVTVDQIPYMSANSMSGCTISSNRSPTSVYHHWMLANNVAAGVIADKASFEATSGYWQFAFSVSKPIIGYTIMADDAVNNAQLPSAWTLEGSNDGTGWTVLDSRSGQGAWGHYEKRAYFLPLEVEYAQYRINITVNNGSQYTSINEFELLSSAGLGQDVSGRGNHWTVNNAPVQVQDTPTDTYCTVDPLVPTAGGTDAITMGNLRVTRSGGSNFSNHLGTITVDRGKWYWEATCEMIQEIGVARADLYLPTATNAISSYPWGYSFLYHGGSQSIRNNGQYAAYGDYFPSGAVIGVALDMDAGKIFFSINGVWQAGGNPVTGLNPAFSGLTGPLTPAGSNDAGTGDRVMYNFGQRPFAYAPPEGFLPLSTEHLPCGMFRTSGTYIGNGQAHGPRVWTGAEMESVTIDGTLYINDGSARGTVDFLCNGFKLRSTTKNSNGTTYTWTGVVREQLKCANALAN